MNEYHVRGGALRLRGTAVAQEREGIAHTQFGWAANAPNHEPDGVLCHGQAGCGDPHGVFVSRGVSAHVSVQEGSENALQFATLDLITFHAYSMAFRKAGVEAAWLPGSCDWTVPQLETYAAVVAAILDYFSRIFSHIPTDRDLVISHADGLDPHATWNPRRHYDSPWKATGDRIQQWVSAAQRQQLDRSPWTSAQFLDRVGFYRGEQPAPVRFTDAIILQPASREFSGALRLRRATRAAARVLRGQRDHVHKTGERETVSLAMVRRRQK